MLSLEVLRALLPGFFARISESLPTSPEFARYLAKRHIRKLNLYERALFLAE
jgi:hypothetical protein